MQVIGPPKHTSSFPQRAVGHTPVKWSMAEYNLNLDANLADLIGRMRRRACNASPVRRVYISKAGSGKLRPLGIPSSIRDGVVQTAAKIVLEPIFEADFLQGSYGFRSKRNAIMALEVIRKSANAGTWLVVDADVSGFFDHVTHWKLLYLIDLRVNDPRMRKAIQEVLKSVCWKGTSFRRPTSGPLRAD